MFLLAWSFALDAVEYAKRKRISCIIWRFVEEARLVNGHAGLICRYAPGTIGKSVNKSQWMFDLLNGAEAEHCVYRSDAYHILVKYEQITPQEGAWLHQPSYWNADMQYSKDRISFFVRLSLHSRRRRRKSRQTCESEPSTSYKNADDNTNDGEHVDVEESVSCSEEPMTAEAMYNLDDVAHLIAQHSRSRHLLHYESTLDAFCEVVFQWTEGKLFRSGVLVDEIYTVDLPPTADSHSRQSSGVESEALSESSTLSASRLSLASSSVSNVQEESPYSLLEVLYIKELLGTNISTQFTSERCLNMLTNSTFSQRILTGWHSDVLPLCLTEEKSSSTAVTPYNHLSLRRKGKSESESGKRSLSPIRKRVDSTEDVSKRDIASASARPLRNAGGGIPTYLRCIRLEDGGRNGDINHQQRLDMSNLCFDDLQTNESAIQNGDKSGAMSATSFRDEDLRPVLEFVVPTASTVASSSGIDSNYGTVAGVAPSPSSSPTITPMDLVEETPRAMLANIPELDSIDAIRDLPIGSPNNVEAIAPTIPAAEPQPAARRYRYVPTAEFARRSSQNAEPISKSVVGRRRLSSMETILDRYARSVAITHFNAKYELPKYCGGWRFSREKIAYYHQFALQRRLSSFAVGGTREDASLFLSRFVEMNLRNGKDRLYSSAVCLNRQSSSLDASGMTHANILDRMAVRMSAMNLFASEHKKRCHSFPRRFFRGGQVTQNNESEATVNSDSTMTTPQPTNSSTSCQPKKFPKSSVKPPSILVYAGDHKELYAEIADLLRSILPPDTYAVRDLTTRALKFHPWNHEQCACLIVAGTDGLDDAAWAQLQHYFNDSGKMLFVCQNALLADLTGCGSVKKQVALLKNVFERKAASGIFGKEFESFLKKSLHQLAKTNEINEVFHAKDAVGGCQFAVVLCKKEGQPFLLYMQTFENHHARSCALFSDATTDQLLRNGKLIADALARLGIDSKAYANGSTTTGAFSLSAGYMMCQQDKLILDVKGMTYGKLFDANLGLIFQHASRKDECDRLPQPSVSCLPVLVCRRSEAPKDFSDYFNYSAYFNALKTKTLGRVLLYVPVCTTTIDIAKSLATAFPDSDGILISGGYQLRGRGRSGNAWLSPRGCATLQFNFNVPMDSELGRSITFVQHIVAVAIVDAIITRVGDEKFPIKIKWPNDIYYKRDFKLGGILVTAFNRGSQFECSIGAGVNISNTKPTVCVNNFLTAGQSLTMEEFLAEVMNKFEHYVQLFTNEGKEAFIRQYARHWMHDGEEISVVYENDENRERVTVRSLNADGFLSVESKRTGRVFSVRDDGNSFDIMHGLIHPKD